MNTVQFNFVLGGLRIKKLVISRFVTFFHCFDCRKDGNDGKRALSSYADGRGSRPKASQREAKAMIALL
jgi:hypothetical protein